MVILHAGLDKGHLLVWGETPSLSPVGRARARRGSRTAAVPLSHGVQAARLVTELARLSPGDALSEQVEATVWTPATSVGPVASSALIAPPPAADARFELTPWRVDAIRVAVPPMLASIRAAADRAVLAAGIVAGSDLTFWGHAARFAAALVARGRFVPSLGQTAGVGSRPRGPRHARPAKARALIGAGSGAAAQWVARWLPVFAGDDLTRLHDLAAAMPDACRAVSLEASGAPGIPPLDALKAFLSGAVDALVRRAALASTPPPVPAGQSIDRRPASAHDAWVRALVSDDARIQVNAEEGAALAAAIADWQRPIFAASGAPFRLVFRLREPDPGDAPAPNTRRSPAQWQLDYLVQAAEDPSLIAPAADIWRHAARARRLFDRHGGDVRAYLLEALGQAAAVSPDVAASLAANEPEGRSLDTARAHAFLTHDAWALDEAGFGVQLPAWWTRRGSRARLTARAHARSPRLTAGTGLSLGELVSVRWEAALGDTALSRDELQLLSEAKVPLVRIRGQWVEISADDRARAAALLKRGGEQSMTASDLVRLAIGADTAPGGLPTSAVSADGWLRDLLASLESPTSLEPLATPNGFDGTLRPYQARGYAWLAFLRRWGLGACLADDMGLGKTVQTLALLERDREHHTHGPVLLIAPTSVVGNWQREVARFTPDLRVLIHHGQARSRTHDFGTEATRHDLVISSYALLSRDVATLSSVGWHGVILDEAQNIKNPDTQQARAARSLRATYRVALTGTPVENHVGDLWSLMEFLNPGLLGTHADFKRRYFVPIQASRDPAAADALKRATGPFILRRTKTDPAIAADLPAKIEMNVFCTLTREQASLYAAVVLDLERALAGAEGIERRGIVLATLSRLKQICNHPAQFLGDASGLGGRSGKLTRLTEMLEEALPLGDRVLVFSQFAQMGELLSRHLQDTFGQEVLFLHGGVDRGARDHMVERFQSADGPPVFVLSLKAGGTGLNLTAANRVLLYDRWWNPAVEQQAIDRAFRIGQRRNVQVHKFLCAGTLEERIDEMIESKKDLAARIVGTGEAWLTELSTEDLRAVLTLGRGAVVE